MRFLLVGAGRIGRLHARLLSETPGVSALTIADAVPERASALASEVEATAAPIDEAMETAEAVVIAASTDAHADLVRASVGRRLPTFCEKPLARDLADTLALATEIEASGIPFQLGFQRRFDAGYREARRLIAAGELGTIYTFRLAGHEPAPPPETYIPVSGGLFRDLSVHDFDILRWLTGDEVTEVYADGTVRGFPVFARDGDVDSAVATLRMASGAMGVLSAARHDPLGYDVRAEIFGSKDSVSVGLGPRMPLRSVEPGVAAPSGPLWPDFLVRFEDAYRAELETFVRVARGEIASPCTARDGVEAFRIAEAATCALREHRPVALSEIAS